MRIRVALPADSCHINNICHVAADVMLVIKGTLHSKLTLDFFAGLKVCIFGKFFTMKTTSIDAVVTEIFKAEMC